MFFPSNHTLFLFPILNQLFAVTPFQVSAGVGDVFSRDSRDFSSIVCCLPLPARVGLG